MACFLTTSCTDALEMAALLLDIKTGDEVIVPSYTFVSTALAFHRQGAVIKFVDSGKENPGLDEKLIEPLINERTKAIIPVHYSGVACDMDFIMGIADKYRLFVVEDAAHAIESTYKGRQLGTIGHLGCISFHETKSIHCGEGGMLAVNDVAFIKRAEVIWEKGTNRSQFFRGDASFYEWQDTGSSFLPSELNAAFLYAQLEKIDQIQAKRIKIWNLYYNELKHLAKKGCFILPKIPGYATNNGYSFFIICKNEKQRDEFISYMKNNGIMCLSHYRPLHKSRFYSGLYTGQELPLSEFYSKTLVRFPLYNEMVEKQVMYIIEKTKSFFK